MASKKQRVNFEQAWQRGFSALKKFKRREGHCRVPRQHLEENYKLGQWVAVQRYIKDTLAPKRKAAPNELGFMWKSTRVAVGERGRRTKGFQSARRPLRGTRSVYQRKV